MRHVWLFVNGDAPNVERCSRSGCPWRRLTKEKTVARSARLLYFKGSDAPVDLAPQCQGELLPSRGAPRAAGLVEPTVAIVFILEPDGARLLAVERKRRRHADPVQLGLPGGKRKPGENLERTARRETAEETALDVRTLVAVHDRPSGVDEHIVRVFWAIEWSGVPVSIETPVAWVTREHLLAHAGGFASHLADALEELAHVMETTQVTPRSTCRS